MSFLSNILNTLNREHPIYVVAHERADGDAIGSQTALTLHLNALDWEAYAVRTEDIADVYKPFTETVPQVSLEEIQEPATWFAVDCAKRARVAPEIQAKEYTLLIDHHPAEEVWSNYSCIQTNACSTCEILTFLLSQNGYKFNDSHINNALYLGLLTDSGNFSHSNTTQHTFECAEHLVRAGVKPYKIIQQIFNNKSPKQLKLQSIFLNNVTLHAKDQIAIATLSTEDYEATQTEHKETEGFVNQLLTIKNVKIGVFLEYNTTFVKGSLRSSEPSILVNKVAQQWDGGGHPCAAGFRCPNEDFSLDKLIHELAKSLN